MMVGDFLQKLATGVLLLARTTTFVQPAGASSSSTEFSQKCAPVISSCFADDTCRQCYDLQETSSARLVECLNDVSVDDANPTATCSAFVDVMCCYIEVYENACIANDNLVDYWRCVLNDIDCPGDEITCDEVSRSGATANVGFSWISAIFYALFVPFLPRLFV